MFQQANQYYYQVHVISQLARTRSVWITSVVLTFFARFSSNLSMVKVLCNRYGGGSQEAVRKFDKSSWI